MESIGKTDSSQEKSNYLLISGHDYRSPRKANIHFICDELKQKGNTRFFSLGYSYLSKLRKDPRASLWSQSNRIETFQGVDCYLWKTVVHPINLKKIRLDRLEPVSFSIYVKLIPDLLKTWIKDANVIILESGMSVILIDLIKRLNPSARLIYRASDMLETIGCSEFLNKTLNERACLFDSIAVSSRKMTTEYPSLEKVKVVRHGLDVESLMAETVSPYGAGLHAVSVGSMLFDASFFEAAATVFPNITFHIIGAGTKADSLQGHANINVMGEMPFSETLPYIKHADIGIAPYDPTLISPYLADTSMKLLQYGAVGLPAVCPELACGENQARFGYARTDESAVETAIKHALEFGRFSPQTKPATWPESVELLLA